MPEHPQARSGVACRGCPLMCAVTARTLSVATRPRVVAFGRVPGAQTASQTPHLTVDDTRPRRECRRYRGAPIRLDSIRRIHVQLDSVRPLGDRSPLCAETGGG